MKVGVIGRWPFIATYIDVPCGQGPYSAFQNGPTAPLKRGARPDLKGPALPADPKNGLNAHFTT